MCLPRPLWSYQTQICCPYFSDKTSKEIFKEQAGDNSLREPGKIEVSFTPRVFPTAARESIAHEEEEV